eukprot:12727650-Alexandrium_andersonii.AAC.1
MAGALSRGLRRPAIMQVVMNIPRCDCVLRLGGRCDCDCAMPSCAWTRIGRAPKTALRLRSLVA